MFHLDTFQAMLLSAVLAGAFALGHIADKAVRVLEQVRDILSGIETDARRRRE